MARRALVGLISSALLAAALAPAPLAAAGSAFPQGTASYAGHAHAVLWTRVTKAGKVGYKVATDRKFNNVVDSGSVTAAAGDNFTVQPTVTGLVPSLRYFFRFTFGSARTQGTFKTLPDPALPASFDFSVSGDSDYLWKAKRPPQDEPFSVLRRIKETNPDFFIYLGDSIYSDPETVVGEEAPDPALTIEEKWAKYRASRRVPASKALLRSVSTWGMFDDHEVINDYDGAVLAQTDPALLQAGQNAFYDYFPIPPGPTYRKIDVGSEADFFVLDERTFRSQSPDEADSPCRLADGSLDLAPTMPNNYRALFGIGGPVDPECLAHIKDPNRTMLGAVQKQWLKENLLASDGTWKFIVNQVPITQLFALPYDRWEGYWAERQEILNFIRTNSIQNVVFLTTDIHANWAAPVYMDIADTSDTKGIAYEVTSGPIQTCHLKCEFDEVAGEGATEDFFQGLRFANLVDLDCVNFKSYGYATVDVSADPAAPLGMRWRNQQRAASGGGQLIVDLNKPDEFCDEQLAPGSYPVP